MASRQNRCQDALANVDLFSELGKGQQRSLARLMTCVDVPAGRTLTTEGQPGREFEGRAPVFLGRCDVEEYQFVSGLRVVALGEFHGVPGIPESHEARAFDNAPVLDVEAGDDAPG